MKTLRTLVILAVVALGAYPVIAHHPAADIVDAEIYEMIDSMVADTPHADLTFDDDMGGMTETEITTDRLGDLEDLVDDGLLTYVSQLDGDVTLTIDFTQDRDVTLTISQLVEPGTGDKALDAVEMISLDDLKASFR